MLLAMTSCLGFGLGRRLARALLGLGELSRVLALDQLDRPTGLLYRLARALRHAGDLEVKLGLQLALSEQADAVATAASKTGDLERVMVERALDIELAGIDRLLHRADVHLGIIAGEDVVEAALRQPHVQRHLAALEAGDADARARLGALVAAASGLAFAGADSAADTHAALTGALIVLEFVELHVPALAFAFVAQLPKERVKWLGRFLDADEVLHLPYLAEHFGSAFNLHRAVEPVEAEADERRPLRLVATDRRAGLGDLDLRHLSLLHHRFGLSIGFGSAGAAASEQVADLLAAPLGNRARARLLLERFERRADHVVRIRRADRLGDHVGNAEALEDRAHRAAGDDSGSGR